MYQLDERGIRPVRAVRRFLHGPHRIVLLAPIGVAAAWFAGIATVQGGNRALLVMILAIAGIAAPILWITVVPRTKSGFLHVELPILLLLLSGLVLRKREAEDLLTNPLDLAGSYRVFAVMLALAIGLLAVTNPTRQQMAGRLTTRPFRLYALYVGVVFIGALPSVNPALTAYRGIELLAGLVVVAGAYRTVGPGAVGRILSVLYWWTVALAITIWAGTVIFPGEGLGASRSPLPWQLRGVLPAVSANGVGTIGSLLILWTLALMISRREDMARPRAARWIVLLGAVTLVFAQYRTGYVATLFGILILIAIRRRQAAIWVLVAAFAVAAFLGPAFLETAQPYLLRGQTVDQASQLSSRLDWWGAALPLWERNPLVGAGLLTGTRFEVLAEIGREQTSTIHGTWIEALVGTGAIGVTLLAASFITLARRSLAEALHPDGRLLPFMLVSVIFIRSLTGSTFEAFGAFTLMILVLALSFRDEVNLPMREPRIEGSLPVS